MAKEARSASPIRAELEPDSSPQSRQRVQLRLTSGHTDAPQHIIELLAIDFYCYHPLIASDAAAKNSRKLGALSQHFRKRRLLYSSLRRVRGRRQPTSHSSESRIRPTEGALRPLSCHDQRLQIQGPVFKRKEPFELSR